MRDLLRAVEGSLGPAAVLAVTFAALYVALGPGYLYSIDEVNDVETAQAVLERGTLEIPAHHALVSRQGVAGGHYSIKPPALAYVCLPLVALGNLLDDRAGSLEGGPAQGPPTGTEEHPLRWGGRLSIFTALTGNALLGGGVVALLFLVGRRLGAGPRASLLMALVSGLATLLTSESTHLLRHPLEALGLLLGFWFFSDEDPGTLRRRMLLGTTGLGVAFLAGPNTAAPAAVLWLYGLVRAWRETAGAGSALSRGRRLLRPAALGLIPAAVAVALYLRFNQLRFGEPTAFGYDEVGSLPAFALDLREAMLAISAYLVSPTLGVFLFAPPLLLALPALRESLRRFPLEAWALLLAAAAQLVPIAFFRYWHGAPAYGPRYLIASIVLLMPLTLPAFERIQEGASPRWRAAVAATFGLGLLVQLLGLAVYVNVDTRRLVEAGYRDAWSVTASSTGRWVFVPSLSPPLVHFEELLAGRNIIPWVRRAIEQPGLPLGFWSLLAASVSAGSLLLRRFYRRGDDVATGTRLPERLVVALASLVGAGFLLTSPVTEPLPARALTYLSEGMAAHREGRHVMAQELYALVLGLEPENKHALYNLGLLHEAVGQADRAARLFERARAADPGFRVASAGLVRLGRADLVGARAPRGAQTAGPGPGPAFRCHSRAQAFWDAGDKRAALQAWEECSRGYPEQQVFVRNVARCRYDLGDFEGAVRDYRTLAAARPDDMVAQTDLAWALLRAGRPDEARDLCETVLGRDPGNASARAALREMDH